MPGQSIPIRRRRPGRSRARAGAGRPARTERKARRMATYFEGIGRRKSSHARVRIVTGSGKIVVNEKLLLEYFPRVGDSEAIVGPLRVSGMEGKLDVTVKVEGGGVTGQTGAVRHGLARALVL